MNQELMTLDFWQDTVIYEGKTLPVGALACDALNVPADIQFQAAGAILLPFSLGDYSVYLAYADCHNFPKRSVVVMKLKTVQRRWCADAKQKTQTDSDAGGRIWRNRLTPKR